jgi:hypothetical protein
MSGGVAFRKVRWRAVGIRCCGAHKASRRLKRVGGKRIRQWLSRDQQREVS